MPWCHGSTTSFSYEEETFSNAWNEYQEVRCKLECSVAFKSSIWQLVKWLWRQASIFWHICGFHFGQRSSEPLQFWNGSFIHWLIYSVPGCWDLWDQHVLQMQWCSQELKDGLAGGSCQASSTASAVPCDKWKVTYCRALKSLDLLSCPTVTGLCCCLQCGSCPPLALKRSCLTLPCLVCGISSGRLGINVRLVD